MKIFSIKKTVNNTAEQGEESITRMLGNTRRIQLTISSTELGSHDERRRYDNATKYGERTSPCRVRKARLPQVRSPLHKVA
jgi:hypothetical protein